MRLPFYLEMDVEEEAPGAITWEGLGWEATSARGLLTKQSHFKALLWGWPSVMCPAEDVKEETNIPFHSRQRFVKERESH